MVKGLEIFRTAFQELTDHYVVIGGTACDILLGREGLRPRATKDIDIILVTEALNDRFVDRLSRFLKEGGYRSQEKGGERRQYYRFRDPSTPDYPMQIELFSRSEDAIESEKTGRFTHIAVGEEARSLSAILMDESYYRHTVEHASTVDGVRVASVDSIICLKATAFLDLDGRKKNGESIDQRDILKHKNDVFRMAVLLAENDRFPLPDALSADLRRFLDTVKDQLPGNDIMKSLNAGDSTVEILHAQLYRNFNMAQQ